MHEDFSSFLSFSTKQSSLDLILKTICTHEEIIFLSIVFYFSLNQWMHSCLCSSNIMTCSLHLCQCRLTQGHTLMTATKMHWFFNISVLWMFSTGSWIFHFFFFFSLFIFCSIWVMHITTAARLQQIFLPFSTTYFQVFFILVISLYKNLYWNLKCYCSFL